MRDGWIIACLLGAAAGATATLWWQKRAAKTPAVLPDLDAAEEGCLALLDLDDFRALVDGHDYDVSTRLIDRIGDALHRALPARAELEQVDEGRFLLRLPAAQLEAAAEIVESLRLIGGRALIDSATGTAMRTLSAGLVQVPAGESRTRAILRCGAQVARAKDLGGDRLVIGAALGSRSSPPSRAEVAEGLASGALRYHVQPIVELATGRIAGLEALLRWTRADGARVEPEAFVDILERIPGHLSDLMPGLLEKVVQPVVAHPDLFVTVNITGAVLDGQGSGSCRWLQDVLQRLPAERLMVEIVESAVIARPDRAEDLVRRLRARGVRVALDDFGTGLSNLDRLRKMPVDVLKLDRGFVAGLGGDGREETILRHLVRMTDELGMSVCAEGIEDEAQLCAVTALGIRYGQGYYLGRPAPVEDWADRLGAV
ncbi:bifunctional diguanylate cyclase/phosphodiesterase [Jannaschia formosa]|uniref:bifunctional diguanylate cyclase/phosphodiesterase n=1 Tax=Jannaschia formosa TaxID=2259592 RepID=UPI000E1BC996|nr:bifunctional diguanylate cyclase/phosphodiesterase [Jannaschia formosa]TFL17745.1 GGDEF domain-containing protein [Jannaschia formosa]